MKYKIFMHLMPWDIDYGLLTASQLKKSSYYLDKEYEYSIDFVLNLSSYIVDWDKSKLPKDFFIKKFKQLESLIKSAYTDVSFRIYEGDKLYGHLDSQKEVIDKSTNYYICLCPDTYFSEHLIPLMVKSAGAIPNEYFLITSEISKMWDSTWDEITSSKYMNIPYEKWNEIDIYDLRYKQKLSPDVKINLEPVTKTKFAGWCDLYNKKFYEELSPVQDSWSGYGPWDWYSMMISDYAKSQSVDFSQYIMRGIETFEYSVGPLKEGGYSKYYKDFLSLKNIPNQRKAFESKMEEYLNKGVSDLKLKGIVK